MNTPVRLALSIEKVVASGVGLARNAEVGVVLVPGAIAGEVVEVGELTKRRGVHNAEIQRVLVPSAMRREAPCPAVALGCGGCDLQHVGDEFQPRLKAQMVEDTFERIAGLKVTVAVREGLSDWGFRTTLRLGVEGQDIGLRKSKSHDLVDASKCLIASADLLSHLSEIEASGRGDLTVRVGDNGVQLKASRGVTLQRGDSVSLLDVTVGERTLRVGINSFFQSRSDGARQLSQVVFEAVAAEFDGVEGLDIVDLYGGVGLLSGELVSPTNSMTLVERSKSSCADAMVNLGSRARIINRSVDALKTGSGAARDFLAAADVVVADPPREGLSSIAVDLLRRSAASLVVLVSCDPAAGARDVSRLLEAGFRLRAVEMVDMFKQSHHVELVSTLWR